MMGITADLLKCIKYFSCHLYSHYVKMNLIIMLTIMRIIMREKQV